MSTALIVVLGLCAWTGLWVLMSFLISAMGGWGTLARYYRSELPFTGKTWRMRSARMGWFTRYGGVLTVGVNPAGLYLALLPLFRVGHPPLFVPWPDVSVTSERRVLASFIVFHFRQAPVVTLWLRERFGREVLETARMTPGSADLWSAVAGPPVR